MFKEIKTRGFIKPAGFYLVKSMRKADFIYFLFSAFFRLCRAAALSPAEENAVFISTASAGPVKLSEKQSDREVIKEPSGDNPGGFVFNNSRCIYCDIMVIYRCIYLMPVKEIEL